MAPWLKHSAFFPKLKWQNFRRQINGCMNVAWQGFSIRSSNDNASASLTSQGGKIVRSTLGWPVAKAWKSAKTQDWSSSTAEWFQSEAIFTRSVRAIWASSSIWTPSTSTSCSVESMSIRESNSHSRGFRSRTCKTKESLPRVALWGACKVRRPRFMLSKFHQVRFIPCLTWERQGTIIQAAALVQQFTFLEGRTDAAFSIRLSTLISANISSTKA